MGEYTYDAFGNVFSDDVPDPFGYCGEYRDGENGLIYLRNRYYDSADGRFITEDPVKDGLNWYAYCGNEPVMMWDPSGLETMDLKMDNITGTVMSLGNMEERGDDLYVGMRDLTKLLCKPCELTWREQGEGAVVTYKFGTDLGTGYVYQMQMTFSSRDEGSQATNINYYMMSYSGTPVRMNKSNKIQKNIEKNNAIFYLKKMKKVEE